MLYERWVGIALERRKDMALSDASSGRQWTFEQLRAAGEEWDAGEKPIVYPQGNNPEFIFSVLSAWRTGKMTCPLESSQSPPDVAPPPSQCIHLKTTSATTGVARFVAFTEAQLVADADNIVTTMHLRPDWPNLAVISIAHSYGFSNLVLPLLLHGIPLVITSALPETVRKTADFYGGVTLAGVPALWRAWHESKVITRNIRLAISAGAPLPLDLERAVFDSTQVKIHNFYGASECGGIAYDVSHVPRSDDTCVGRPMNNVSLGVSGEGCMVVHGANVGETYWPESTPDLGQGRFQTTDLAELRDGNVFLRGRVSDLINVAGRKVSPFSIERELLAHAAVKECLVFGVPDHESDRTELIIACVVPTSPTTSETLNRFLQEKIPAWQLPRDWMFVESLLPGRVGKVSRAAWRERYLQGRKT
jgi:long-chain acyl-CoA synthetase